MLSAGGVDWQITVNGGVLHSFTNEKADRLGRPDVASYDAKADARSWEQMSALFKEAPRVRRKSRHQMPARPVRLGKRWDCRRAHRLLYRGVNIAPRAGGVQKSPAPGGA